LTSYLYLYVGIINWSSLFASGILLLSETPCSDEQISWTNLVDDDVALSVHAGRPIVATA